MDFNPFSLSGKTILVTGAASGMGKATALACSKMGASVVAADFNEAGLSETMSELAGSGHHSFSIDLADEGSWNGLVSGDFALDGIASCAGIANMNPFAFVSKAEFDKVFGVNFLARSCLSSTC